MKKLFGGVVFLFLVCGMAWAQAVTVYDVGVEPDSLNKKVTVTYRLAETNGGFANVAVDISSDAGDTWTVPADTFYPGSDVGPGIPADGSLRQLIWDARADWNNQYSTQMIVRLNATVEESQDSVYYISGGKLYRMNLDGSACTLLCSGLPKTTFSAVDMPNHRVMFSCWGSGSPVWAYDTVTGGNAGMLYTGPGIGGGQGLAYDAETQQLFLGLYYNGVYRMDLQAATGWQQIVDVSALSPMIGQRGQLELDPANQQVYFRSAYNGTCDDCRWIWRVNYDGTGLIQITQANGDDAMAVDLTAGYIYFAKDTDSNVIWRANLDGTGLESFLTLPSSYPTCLAIKLDVAADKMYMYLFADHADWTGRAIGRADLDGTGFEIIKTWTDSVEGYGLALYIP